ncbi:unnamed protein product [marine sediment metagenome]|uniref:Uncharacterized protein n=1 Tax=marine sediment metagenome TaxID=412755 RepID=X0XVR6_9ZZZZ
MGGQPTPHPEPAPARRGACDPTCPARRARSTGWGAGDAKREPEAIEPRAEPGRAQPGKADELCEEADAEPEGEGTAG